MSPAEIPDRRPLLYIIMGVVIAAIAVVLFWPQGEDEPAPSMVLTPESVRQASDLATDVDPQAETTDTAAATASDAVEDADVPEESFPVTDAKLPADLDATPQPAKTTTTAKPASTTKTTTTSTQSKPVSKPAPPRLDSALTQPSSVGDYVIYVGSYSDRTNAQRAASDLKSKGIEAFVMDAGAKHRVAVGYFASSAKAEVYGKSMKSKLGLDFWVAQAR